MLELYSKKRFVVIFKDCPFDGDWKNCYLKENEIELGYLKKSGKFIILKNLSIKFPYDEFLKLIESPNSTFEDLLRISPNVLKMRLINLSLINFFIYASGSIKPKFLPSFNL